MTKRKLTRKEQKKNKDLVEKLLLIQNKNYNEWLNDKHEEYIEENSNVLLETHEKAIYSKSKRQNKHNNQQKFHSQLQETTKDEIIMDGLIETGQQILEWAQRLGLIGAAIAFCIGGYFLMFGGD